MFNLDKELKDILKDINEIFWTNGQKYKSEYLGEGAFGKIIVPHLDSHIKNDYGHELPIIYKETKGNNESLKLYKNYITGDNCLGTEVLILHEIKKYEKDNPHLPLILGYITFNDGDNIYIKGIITERHGLLDPINLKNDIYPFGLFIYRNIKTQTNITTVKQLFDCMFCYNMDVINCKPHKLVDYFCITYLCTYMSLKSKGITILDMHLDNIFIHWLGENSWMGDKSLKKVKHIVYVNKDFKLQIDTHGIILKMGDIGCSIYEGKKYTVLGSSDNIENKEKEIKLIQDSKLCTLIFLDSWSVSIPFDVLKNTVLYRILTSHPLDKIPIWNSNVIEKYYHEMMTPLQALQMYKKYNFKTDQPNTLYVNI